MKKMFFLLLAMILLLSIPGNAFAMTVNEFPDTSVIPERNMEHPTWPSVTGFYQYTVTTRDGEERAVYEYIPEEMGTKRPTVLIAEPDGADSLSFLETSGWKELADEFKFDIILCEPKEGAWGAPAAEDAYIDAALAYCTQNVIYRHGGQCAFYLIGYEAGADVMLYEAVTYPQMFAGAAFLGCSGIEPEVLEEMRNTPSADPARMISEIPLQVWISAKEKTDAIEELVQYYVEANNCSSNTNQIYSDPYAEKLYHPLRWMSLTNEITDADVNNVYVNCSGLDIYDNAFTRYLWDDVLRHVQWAPAYTAIRATRPWAEAEELGYVREEINVDGINREFYIYVPQKLRNTEPADVPMVICFHGMNVNGNESAVRYGWYKIAEERGFIVVCPTGSQQGTSFPTNFMWTPADVPFVSALIDYMAQNYPVDTSRVYTTGSSNGSMMSLWLQLMLPERIAASASYDMVMDMSAYPSVNDEIKIATLCVSGSYDPNYGSKLDTGEPTEAFLLMEKYFKDRLGLKDAVSYQNGNYVFYYYNNDAGVPLFVFENCLTRIHADMPEDCYVCYDYMARFSRGEDGTLFYMGVPVE